MAMDFPVSPMDRLPIFPDEACSTTALMELIGGAGRGEEESANGSRGAVVCEPGRSSPGQSVGPAKYGEQASVAAGVAAMSGFSIVRVKTPMPLNAATWKPILMETMTLRFKIKQIVAMEALLNLPGRWILKHLAGQRGFLPRQQ